MRYRCVPDQGVSVVSVDPGNVETRIFRHFPPLSHPVLKLLQWPLRLIVVKTPLEGAQTLLHAVLSEDLKSGTYLRYLLVVFSLQTQPTVVIVKSAL